MCEYNTLFVPILVPNLGGSKTIAELLQNNAYAEWEKTTRD